MKKFLTVILVMFFAVALTAQNAHLVGPIKVSPSLGPATSITISGKIAGLGGGDTWTVYLDITQLKADAYCVTKKFANRTAACPAFIGPLAVSGTFTKQKNGNLVFSFVIPGCLSQDADYMAWLANVPDCPGSQNRVFEYTITNPKVTWGPVN